MCERARTLLDSGVALEAMAPAPLRLQLALYRLGGLAIRDAIDAAGFHTATRSPGRRPPGAGANTRCRLVGRRAPGSRQ